jgi:hypothetical protein
MYVERDHVPDSDAASWRTPSRNVAISGLSDMIDASWRLKRIPGVSKWKTNVNNIKNFEKSVKYWDTSWRRGYGISHEHDHSVKLNPARLQNSES